MPGFGINIQTWADLCASLDEDEDALRQTLAGVDYHYDPVHNQFI